jgi:hypothetical protein
MTIDVGPLSRSAVVTMQSRRHEEFSSFSSLPSTGLPITGVCNASCSTAQALVACPSTSADLEAGRALAASNAREYSEYARTRTL